MAGLLSDVRVLDLSAVGPASRAAGWLADYGADVVKVAPPVDAVTPPPHAYSGGRGTRLVRVDLKSDGGREVFLRLAEVTDVVLESFRPGVADRLGIGYEAVRACNRGVVYCATSGYGRGGERAGWAGHDLNYLAAGGFLAGSEPGEGGKPPLPGTTVADSAAGGLQAVAAILAGLVGRARTGEGCYLDVSITDGVRALMALQVDAYLATGEAAVPGSAPLGARFACYDTYQAGDGGWLTVAAIEGKFWANLCERLGLADCVGAQYDPSRQSELRSRLAQAFATRSRDEWAALLGPADTCVAPVLSVPEVAAEAAGSARRLPPLLAGTVRADDGGLGRAATTEVLAELGFSAATIDELRAAGAVR